MVRLWIAVRQRLLVMTAVLVFITSLTAQTNVFWGCLIDENEGECGTGGVMECSWCSDEHTLHNPGCLGEGDPSMDMWVPHGYCVELTSPPPQ